VAATVKVIAHRLGARLEKFSWTNQERRCSNTQKHWILLTFDQLEKYFTTFQRVVFLDFAPLSGLLFSPELDLRRKRKDHKPKGKYFQTTISNFQRTQMFKQVD
jgi:hypothetical protein